MPARAIGEGAVIRGEVLEALLVGMGSGETGLDFAERIQPLLQAVCLALQASGAWATLVESRASTLVSKPDRLARTGIAGESLEEFLREVLSRDPALHSFRAASGLAVRLSDLLAHGAPAPAWRRFHARARIAHRLTWSRAMPDGSLLLGAVLRSPDQADFSDDDLSLARPLGELLARAGRREVYTDVLERARAQDGLGAPLLVLDQGGQLELVELGAAALLARVGPRERAALIHQVLRRTPERGAIELEVGEGERLVRARSFVLSAGREVTYLIELQQVGAKAARPSTRLGLTARQSEIAGLVAQGLRNATIAERLGTSESFVRKYVTVIMRRTGTTSRTELAHAVWRATHHEG